MVAVVKLFRYADTDGRIVVPRCGNKYNLHHCDDIQTPGYHVSNLDLPDFVPMVVTIYKRHSGSWWKWRCSPQRSTTRLYRPHHRVVLMYSNGVLNVCANRSGTSCA